MAYLIALAKADLKLARTAGRLAITNSKKGTIYISYGSRRYTIHDGKGWAYFVGASEGAVKFLVNNYKET